MARNENPPFSRGETFYNGGTITADSSTSLYGGYEHEGKIWEFEDLIYTQSGVVGSKQYRTNRAVKCMACRNKSGISLLPGYVVQFSTSGGSTTLGSISGYCTKDGQSLVGVVDEWLPSGGVPANDLFWVVVGGPTSVYTPPDGGADNVFVVGTELIALTAAASTAATTAGRVQPLFAALSTSVTNGLTTNTTLALNVLGYALSAATTANTNTSILAVLKNLPWADV